MLTVSILAAGRAKAAPEQALALDYMAKARDLGRPLGFAGFALSECDERKFGPALAQAATPVLLDERGRAMPSRPFAQWLATKRDQGLAAMTFVIGPADGFQEADRAAAHALVALGPQTWPHMLVRPMLAEQIYRAMTILAGHPYHRD